MLMLFCAFAPMLVALLVWPPPIVPREPPLFAGLLDELFRVAPLDERERVVPPFGDQAGRDRRVGPTADRIGSDASRGVRPGEGERRYLGRFHAPRGESLGCGRWTEAVREQGRRPGSP